MPFIPVNGGRLFDTRDFNFTIKITIVDISRIIFAENPAEKLRNFCSQLPIYSQHIHDNNLSFVRTIKKGILVKIIEESGLPNLQYLIHSVFHLNLYLQQKIGLNLVYLLQE